MTRYDLHIIRRLFTGTFVLLGVLIVFFIVLHYVEYIDDFMDRSAKMSEIFTVYYLNFIPEIVKLTSPLAVFLASIYLMGRLAQSLQIVALQSSGVSLYRLTLPFAVYAVIVTGFMFWFNGWVVPITNRTVLEFDQKHLKDAPRPLDVTNVHRQNSPHSLVTVGYFDRRDGIAHRVSLHHFADDQRLLERVDAQRMEWIDSLGVWRLHQTVVRTFDGALPERRRAYATLDTTLQVFPRDLARTERDVESMTIPTAAEYVDALRRSGAGSLGRTLVGYYGKYAYPFANLILLLIGVPLAAVRRRGGQAVQIGLGLLTAFAYLAAQKLTEPFGYSGALHPLVTAWLPHLAFLGVALVMLMRARK